VLGDVTVVYVDSKGGQGLISELYSEIAGFAPALVLLEDLDLLVGSRHDDSARYALFDFLTVLDGLMTQHRDIVTVATTNEPEAIDAGVRRAARFDQIVTFLPPDLEARERILEVYLHAVPHAVDVAEVAYATDGKTGADLRECVRAALLAAEGTLNTSDMIRVIDADDELVAAPPQPEAAPTQYL
jgi:SpoVK/Ycf46/Vps4 family AAA+-type ATPase